MTTKTNKTKFRFSSALMTSAAIGVIALASAAPALADCTTPDAPAGSINYVDASTGFEWCNGTSWQGIAGASALGDLSDAYTDYDTDNNLFIGQNAGANILSGAQYNTILGKNAFDATLTEAADYNAAFGYAALTTNTSGSRNTAIGTYALQLNTSGSYNVALGDAALRANTSGNNSTSIGRWSLHNSTTGDNNIAIGYQAGDNITTGSNNIIIGYDIDASSGDAENELNIGDAIFGDLSTGNIGIGTASPSGRLHIADAMLSNESLVILQNTADTGTQSTLKLNSSGGNRDIGIGLYNQGTMAWEIYNDGAATPNNSLVFENASDAAVLTIEQSGNVGIGTTAPEAIFHVVEPDFDDVALFERSDIGANGPYVTARFLATKTTDMGNNFGPILTFAIRDNADVIHNIAYIGAVRTGADNNGSLVFHTMQSNTNNEHMRITNAGDVGIGTTTPTQNGDQPLKLEVAGYIGATGICDEAGLNCTTAANLGGSSALGDLSDAITDYVTDRNMFMGSNAGANIVADAQWNTVVGQNAFDGLLTSDADSNNAFGYNSLSTNTSGARNSAFGTNTLVDNTTGSYNTAIGAASMYKNNIGSNNTAIGRSALYENTTGSNNIAIGYQAGDNITTGSNNIIIGYDIDASSGDAANELNIGDAIFGDLSTGDIGIGINDPKAKMHIKHSSSNLTPSPVAGLFVENNGSANNAYVFQTATIGGGKSFSITNAGNVGIGTTSPSAPLTVSDGATATELNSGDFDIGAKIVQSTARIGGIQVENKNTGGQTRFLALGDDGSYTTLTHPGTTSTGSWFGKNKSNTSYLLTTAGTGTVRNLAIGTLGARNVTIGTNDTAALTIDTDQEVGIGTASPGAPLHLHTAAASSSRENLMLVTTGESTYSSLGLGNFSTEDDIFIPMLWGYNDDDNRAGVGILGLVSSDSSGGEIGVIDFNVADIAANAADPINASRNSIGSHDLFSWRENGTMRMVMNADGDLIIGSTTVSSDLMLDVAGKIGATHYCDEDGDNCTAAASLGASSSLGGLSDAITDYDTDHNMVIGSGSGGSIISGAQYNTIVGEGAFAGTTTNAADGNTALGYNALKANTIGESNIAIGAYSSDANTEGASNTALGRSSLGSNTTGSNNVAIGRDALFNNIDGANNVSMGYSSGKSINSGSNNIAIGYHSGDNITTGSNNIIIGYDIDAGSATGDSQLNIGDAIYGDLSTGYIGLGASTSPETDLDIDAGGSRGAIRISSSVNANAPVMLQLESTTTNSTIASGDRSLEIRNYHTAEDGSRTITSAINGIATATGATNTDLKGALTFKTSNGGGTSAERMRIAEDGKVGIGTSNPTNALTLGSAGNTTISTDTIDASDDSYINITGGGGVSSGRGASIGLSGNERSGYGGRIEYIAGLGNGSTSGYQRWLTNTGSGDSERMRLSQAGNLGIGTTNPSSLLSVASHGAQTTGNFTVDNYGKLSLITAVGGPLVYVKESGINYVNANAAIVADTGNADGTKNYSFQGRLSGSNTFSVRSDGQAYFGNNIMIGSNADNVSMLSIAGSSVEDTGAQSNISDYSGNGIRIRGSAVSSQDAITYRSGSSGGGAAIAFGRGGSWGTFIDFYTNSDSSNTVGAISNRAVRIDSNGNVGIGGNPSYKLDVAGNMQVQGSSTTCVLGDGSGTTSCSSDERLKENITEISGALDKIDQLRGVTFTWKDHEKDQSEKVGVIAQDVQKVFPQIVGALEDGTLTVDYGALVAPLIEASKELKAENETLRAELDALKDDVNGLKAHTGYGTAQNGFGFGALLGALLTLIGIGGLSIFGRRKQ